MATIKDVARLAGVSVSTVSRILNGNGEACDETVQRVTKLADSLHYRPNRMARSLSRRQSDLIAVMMPNLTNPYFSELVTAIQAEAKRQQLQILICDTGDDRSRVEYYLQTIADNYVFGAIICTLQVRERDLEALEGQGVHVVTIDRTVFEGTLAGVHVDQFQGAYDATHHLVSRGASRILFLSGPQNDVMTDDRERGYLAALRAQGLSYSSVERGDYSMECGRRIVQSRLESGDAFDGIFAANDLMALGAIRACQDSGVEIPRQMHIVGNDNLALDDYTYPRLTSLSQEHSRVSELAVHELVALHANGDLLLQRNVKPHLVIRESA